MLSRVRQFVPPLVAFGAAACIGWAWAGAAPTLAAQDVPAPALPAAQPPDPTGERPQRQTAEERWFVVELQGQRAGWMLEQVERDSDRITTTSRSLLRIGRADTPVEVEFRSVFIETIDHEPVSMAAFQRLGQQPTETHYEFVPDGVRVRTTQGGRTTTTVAPQPEGEWLTPAAAGAFVEARLRAGASEIVTRELDPLTGLEPIVNTLADVTPGAFEVGGTRFEGYRCKVSNSAAGGEPADELRDARGHVVRSSLDLGGLRMLVVRSTREEAVGGPLQGPELMVSTFVRPDRSIAAPRRATRASYLLSVPDGELPDLPNTGSQHVERLAPDRARVRVDASHPHASAPADAGPYLASTSTADADDPEVEALARDALRTLDESAEPAARAERLRRRVFEHVGEKNLGTALASASEVVRTREGDCTEHAVLLAALLRDAGIPSRVAAGLLYVERFAGESDVFGYHMWTQALLPVGAGEPRWIDLDATLPAARAYDATHIALTTSDLAEGDSILALARLTAVLGRLRIEVERAE